MPSWSNDEDDDGRGYLRSRRDGENREERRQCTSVHREDQFHHGRQRQHTGNMNSWRGDQTTKRQRSRRDSDSSSREGRDIRPSDPKTRDSDRDLLRSPSPHRDLLRSPVPERKPVSRRNSTERRRSPSPLRRPLLRRESPRRRRSPSPLCRPLSRRQSPERKPISRRQSPERKPISRRQSPERKPISRRSSQDRHPRPSRSPSPRHRRVSRSPIRLSPPRKEKRRRPSADRLRDREDRSVSVSPIRRKRRRRAEQERKSLTERRHTSSRRRESPSRRRVRRKSSPSRRHRSSQVSDWEYCSCSECEERIIQSECECSDCEYKRRRRRRRKDSSRRKQEAVIDSDASGIEASKGPVGDRYGKYGLISDADRLTRKAEFQAWSSEVKGVNYESLTSGEEKQLWSIFMEDYNTATFPSKKYYNLSIWVERSRGITAPSASAAAPELFDDEELRRREMRAARHEEKAKELDEAYRKLKEDSEVVQAMRRQKELRNEMDYLFKTGKVEAAREIQALLRGTSGAAAGGGQPGSLPAGASAGGPGGGHLDRVDEDGVYDD